MTQSYYSDDAVTIYHGDCRELVPTLRVDAVITDPPYGSGLYATDTVVLNGDLLRSWPRPCAVFGWPERLVALCLAAELTPDEWITWAPTNGGCRGFNMRGLWRDTEHIAVFGPGHWERVRRPRSQAASRLVDAAYAGEKGRLDKRQAEARAGDVWNDPAPGLAFQSHRRQHPNEKPVTVLARLVEALSDPGQVILDPFVGSGTTLRAAKDLGRRAIGIEIEERYCEIAARRCAQDVLDLGMAA